MNRESPGHGAAKEILSIANLRLTAITEWGDVKVLVDDVSLSLHRGEVLGLIGETGAGKTTIGLCALAYMRPGCAIAGGRIFFDGSDIRDMPARERRKLRGRRIAYIAQSAAASFNPAMRLGRQICEIPVRHGVMSYAQAQLRMIELFNRLRLPSPETFGNNYPHQVSGGQLQRAMLAMAMSCNPDILVFDEPTTALDVTTQVEVLAAIRALIRDHHTAGLYISHDLAVVAQLADRIMVLRDGRMVEIGGAQQVLEAPGEEYTRKLVAARAGKSSFRPLDQGGKEALLQLSGVSASYKKGQVRAVEQVSLTAYRGETLAVVGESGSGKSTLARVVCGLQRPSAGSIVFDGQPLGSSVAKRSREELRRIQLIYQMPDVALNPRQKLMEILGRPVQFYFGASSETVRRRVFELLDMIGLPRDHANRRPGELSGGQKQRVCIARALAARPDLIICDEVTSALDALVAEDILGLLDRLQRETGVTYLFITHDLGLVRRIATRVLVMLKGAVVAEGAVATVFSPPFHPYTETLMSSVPEMRVDWLDEVLRRRSLDRGEGAEVEADELARLRKA